MSPFRFQAWLVLVALVLLPACKSPDDESKGGQAGRSDWPGYFVSASWVAAHKDRLQPIDIRPVGDYEAGHLEGAVNLPLALWHDHQIGRTDRMAPAVEVERILSEAGVARSDRLVCYGEAGQFGPARVAFILDAYGHERVTVMLEGMKGWGEMGGALTSESPGLPASRYKARLCGERVANELAVLNAMADPEVILLDVRRGSSDPDDRVGKIPSSVTPGLEEVVMPPVDLAQLKELQGVLRRFVGPEASHVLYSDDGMRASLVSLAVRDLGVRVAVYDGGWNEWASLSNIPIEWAEPSGQALSPPGPSL